MLWRVSDPVLHEAWLQGLQLHRHFSIPHELAKGIMQILPSTFEEIRKKNPHYKSIDDPH